MVSENFKKFIDTTVLVFFISFMFIGFPTGSICLFSMDLLHELGHFMIAKEQKIFKGFSGSVLTLNVKLTRPFSHRTDYLSGALGLASFPIFLIFLPEPIWLCFVLNLVLMSFDLIVFFFYNRVVRSFKEK